MQTTKPIVIVGEARTEQDERYNTSFVSAGGIELIRMLAEAGVINLTSKDRADIHAYYSTSQPPIIERIWSAHPEIYRTNVFNIHPPRNDLDYFCGPKTSAIPGYPSLGKSKYVRTEFEPELDRLAAELINLDPNLVLCLGNCALWALSGRTGIMRLRGTTLASTHTAVGFKLLPTYHPYAILRQWELRPTVIADFMKATKEALYAEIRRPHRQIYIEPTIDDIRTFIDTNIRGCDLLSVDIETSGNRITCIGFAPGPDIAIVIPFDDERKKNGCYWESREDELHVWRLIACILHDANIPKLFQNGAYDIAFLWRAYGIKTFGATEDTMLLSHALQPESLKGLGYLGSIYSDEGSWKHMRKKDETVKRDA